MCGAPDSSGPLIDAVGHEASRRKARLPRASSGSDHEPGARRPVEDRGPGLHHLRGDLVLRGKRPNVT